MQIFDMTQTEDVEITYSGLLRTYRSCAEIILRVDKRGNYPLFCAEIAEQCLTGIQYVIGETLDPRDLQEASGILGMWREVPFFGGLANVTKLAADGKLEKLRRSYRNL